MNPFKAKPKRRTADATPPTVASLEDYEIATNTVSKTIYQRVGSTIVAIANYFDASGVLAAVLTGLSTVTNAAITSADTVLSALGKLQAQINSASGAMAGKVNTSSINQPNGVAGLDASAKLNPSTLPALAITDTFPVSSQAAMLALAADVGDVAIRSDISKTFILRAMPASTLANWSEILAPTAGVSSVFGRTGAVTAQAGDYTFAQIGSKPTTRDGFGITDVPTLTGSGASGAWPITVVGSSGRQIVSIDSRNTATTPETLTAAGVNFDFKSNSIEGLSDGGLFFGAMTFRKYGAAADWSGGGSTQLGFTENGNIWTRYGIGTTWQSWRKLWHSGNFDPATKVTNGGGVSTVNFLSASAYAALGTKDGNTLYLVY